MSGRVKVPDKPLVPKRGMTAARVRRTEYVSSHASPCEHLMRLQQSIGNQAVQRLLEADVIQAKLRIGVPNDIYEQEADRMADQVMRIPDKEVSGKRSAVSSEGIQLKPG